MPPTTISYIYMSRPAPREMKYGAIGSGIPKDICVSLVFYKWTGSSCSFPLAEGNQLTNSISLSVHFVLRFRARGDSEDGASS